MTDRGKAEEILARRRQRNRERQRAWRRKVGVFAVRNHDKVRRQNVKTLTERVSKLEEQMADFKERFGL